MNYAATFQRMRLMAGNPVLTCVKPRAQWASVPTGYTFDADYDAYINVGGETWKPETSASLGSNDYETVPFLPGSGNADQQLVMAGVVDQGQRMGRVLPGNVATVQAAQWLELDGYTYDLAEATPMPGGAAMWYMLRLTKR
jgi:hypothetical protein